MGILGNLKTGWTLSVDSLGVIREHPKLLAFPALSGVATAAFFLAFYVGVFATGALVGGAGFEAGLFVALAAVYFATTFVASFFTAALVAAVNDALHGREPTIRGGMRAAWAKKAPIAVWSAIAAVVSLIVRQAERSNSPLARITSGFFALGWTVTTFFIVPVIVFEDVSVTEMFSKSAGTFRDTWGETLGAGLGLGVVQLLLAVAAVALAVVAFVVGSALSPDAGFGLAVLVGGLGLLVAYLVGQTIRGVTKTVLYLFAREGVRPESFADFDFETLGGRTGKRATPGDKRVESRH